MTHVFISYSHSDSNFALELKRQLLDAQFDVWLDAHSIPIGKGWKDEIDKKLRESFAVALVISPEAVTSQAVNYEWIYALGAGIELIPIYLREISVFPYRLEDLQYINFRGSYQWEKLIELLKNIQRESNPEMSDQISSAIKSLESWDREERQKAANFLGTKKVKASIPKLLEALKDEHHFVRIAACKALGEIGDSAAIAKLIEVFQHDNSFGVRNAAIDAIREIKSPIPASILIVAMSETYPAIRVPAAHALLEIGQAPDISQIIDLLRHKDELVRRTSAWVLGGLKAGNSSTALINALQDVDSGVRAYAAGALGDINSFSAVNELINLLSDNSSFNSIDDSIMRVKVCDIAAEALRKIKTPESIKALENWKQNKQRNSTAYNNIDQEDMD